MVLPRPCIPRPPTSVDVAPVGDAVEGAVLEVRHFWVVSVDEVVEHMVDAQLELILLEDGQDLLYGQSVLDVLFPAYPGRLG